MRKRLLLMGFGVVCAVGGGLVAHAATGTPEIDRANANIQMGGNLKSVSCVGEDGMKYLTFFGSYKGGESQVTPDPTDYSLTGNLAINGIRWTINSATGRGVLTGTITLSNSAGAVVYAGPLILVTQGTPVGAVATARGWINALVRLPDEGTTKGDDSLIANVEFKLSTTSAVGVFGDLPAQFGIPDYSVITNVAPLPQDGVC